MKRARKAPPAVELSEPAELCAADNDVVIFTALRSGGSPMSADAILDAVRSSSITAPTTVYRALARLMKSGVVMLVRLSNGRVLPVCEPDGSAVSEMTFNGRGRSFACGTESDALTLCLLGDPS